MCQSAVLAPPGLPFTPLQVLSAQEADCTTSSMGLLDLRCPGISQLEAQRADAWGGGGKDSDVRAFISLALSPGPRWPVAFLNRRSQPFSQWPSFLLLGSDNVSLSSFPSSGGGKRALLCPL